MTTVEGIKIVFAYDTRGDRVAIASFIGSDGSPYKELGFGKTDDERISTAVQRCKDSGVWAAQSNETPVTSETAAAPEFDFDNLSAEEEYCLKFMNGVIATKVDDDETRAVFEVLVKRGFAAPFHHIGYRLTADGRNYLRAAEVKADKPAKQEALEIVDLLITNFEMYEAVGGITWQKLASKLKSLIEAL